MPYMTTREIGGKTYERNAFLAKIAETIDDVVKEKPEGASVADIVTRWGDPAWHTTDQKQWLARELNKLLSRQTPVIARGEGRGLYKVATAYRLQGATNYEMYALQAREALIANGGFIQYGDLRKALGIEARVFRKEYDVNDPGFRKGRKRLSDEERYKERDWQNEDSDNNLRAALARSPDIRNYFPIKGLWHLTTSRLNTLPLEARWARLLCQYGTEGATADLRPEPEALGKAVRANFNAWLTSVGGCYADLRASRRESLDALLTNDRLREEVEKVAATHPDRIGFTDFLADPDRPDKPVKGDTRPKAFYSYDDPDDWPACVLEMYEDGDPTTHDLVLTTWHHAFAAYYHVDPAALSRGAIAALLDPF